MKRKNATRSALVTSVISLLLCVSMLVGTTFAWFTDSITSANNIIKSGNLDVELEYMNSDTADWTKVTETTNVFQDALWEPGHTEMVKLRVSNAGSLALKYQLGINIVSETGSINKDGEDFMLSDHIYYGVVEGDQTYTRQEAVNAVKDNAALITQTYSKPGVLEAEAEPQVVTLVVYMPESVGNEANHAASANVPQIDLGINLVATQQTAESDSFGPDYDADATYPASSAVNVPEGTVSPTAVEAGDVTVYIPAGAAEGAYVLKVDNKTVTDNSVSYNISLFKDGAKVSGVMYRVEIEIGAMLDIASLTHNGTAITEYTYDAMQGVISFETDSFSPFTVTYNSIPATDVEFNEDGKIVAGVFEGINPAKLDESLAAEGSEYIAINYEKDGKTNYVVSKRSTTVIVAADAATDYVPENANYKVEISQSGKLYSVISGLKNNEHSTVYLLPGTYTEGTTINVYSSMDIIGLGDKDTVKVIKAAGASSSNRHLFNCNGTKDEYIHVTLRNLYLDATAKTSDNKDNAAVQSIRRTKVKCYDLTIVKNATDMAAVAFYVNGNNTVNGERPAAYLYAENCSLNSKSSVSVGTYSGTYKFYYSGLTYNNGTAFSTSNANVKNQVMEADDWDW